MRQDALSLQDRLFRWLKLHPNEWINGGELERLAMDAGYKASNASRRLRELAEWGPNGQPPEIERDERPGPNGSPRSVWYRWREDYKPAGAPYTPVDEWEERGIAWYRQNYPEGLAGFVESLRAWHEVPEKPRSDFIPKR